MNFSALFSKRVMLLGLVLALSACQNDGEGLAGDLQADSKCPPGGCAGLAADVNQISISSAEKTTIYQAPNTNPPNDVIELGGPCYSSTYPGNKVEVRAFFGSTPVTLSASDVVGVASDDTVPRCRNGRFNLALNGARFPAGGIYKIRIELVGLDAGGQEHRNAGTGVLEINVSR